MAAVLRPYDPQDFSALYRLDQSCFPAGISYSKTTLRYFLSVRTADCLVAMEDAHIAGFILTEENPPLAHVITLDVAAGVAFWQRHGYLVAATLKRYYLGRLDAYEMRKILLAPATKGPAKKEI